MFKPLQTADTKLVGSGLVILQFVVGKMRPASVGDKAYLRGGIVGEGLQMLSRERAQSCKTDQ